MRLSASTRKWLTVLATIVALALWWWAEQPGAEPGAGPAQGSSQGPSQVPSHGSSPSAPATQAAPDGSSDGLPTIDVDALPPEARETITLIQQGGPFPYERDGVVFENREGILPEGHPRGYYREYTVRTPGEDDRGARRIVTGGEVLYYTDDHYDSFARIEGAAMREQP